MERTVGNFRDAMVSRYGQQATYAAAHGIGTSTVTGWLQENRIPLWAWQIMEMQTEICQLQHENKNVPKWAR